MVIAIRKRIKSDHCPDTKSYREVFNKELRMLSLLRPLEHPNIIRLLASYTYNNEHNFLFPRLKMDLRQFLHMEERFGEFCWDATFHLALYGLASAVESLHKFHLTVDQGLELVAIGYHHDLRPANILVTEKTFVLADFGLGGLAPPETDPKIRWVPNPGDYFAPECEDEDFTRQVVSQKIDSWAFGCLVAEVLTYIRKGPKGVERFLDLRQEPIPHNANISLSCFYRSKDKVKPSVCQWLDDLKISCVQMHEIVETALLVLEPNPEKRPEISEARLRLAVSTLRVLVDQVLRELECYFKTKRDLQRLGMNLFWAHTQILLFAEAVSPSFEEESHFARNLKAFDGCSVILTKILRCVGSESSRGAATSTTQRVFNNMFECELEEMARDLANQLPPELRKRAEGNLFTSMFEGNDRFGIITTYMQSHEKMNRIRESVRENIRDLLEQMKNHPETGAQELYHHKRHLQRIESKRGHDYGLFKGQRVLIESMYWKSEERTVSPNERLRIMQLRAKSFNLEPKPLGLRILKCLGFVDEVARFDGRDGYSFIYELPSNTATTNFRGLISLAELFNNQRTVQRPKLRERFHLAFVLASFLQEFHQIICLHENFGAHNIVFAGDPSVSDPYDASLWGNPFVIGLQKSRPDGQQWSTEGPADMSASDTKGEHPEYREKGRFLMEYDYYSFGVVLLQLGSWTPVEMLTDVCEIRKKPDHIYLEKLSRHVGQRYSDVIRVCLDGTLDRQNGQSMEDANGDILQKFVRKVVKPLEQLAGYDI
jgi:serine/threonine protein kinase